MGCIVVAAAAAVDVDVVERRNESMNGNECENENGT
jgi:hypothetical protein